MPRKKFQPIVILLSAFFSLPIPVSAQSIIPATTAETALSNQSVDQTAALDEVARLKEIVASAAKTAELARLDAKRAELAKAETVAEAEEFAIKAAGALVAKDKAELAAQAAKTAEDILAAKIATDAATDFAEELALTAQSYAQEAEKHVAVAAEKEEIAVAAENDAAEAADALVSAELAVVRIEAELSAKQPEQAVVLSEEIELRSRDGLVSVLGILTDFDADLITIKTSYGTVGIEREGIDCFGTNCPAELLAN